MDTFDRSEDAAWICRVMRRRKKISFKWYDGHNGACLLSCTHTNCFLLRFCNKNGTETFLLNGPFEMVTLKVNRGGKLFMKSHSRSMWQRLDDGMFTFSILGLCVVKEANGIKLDDDRPQTIIISIFFFHLLLLLVPVISAIWIMAQRSWGHCWPR